MSELERFLRDFPTRSLTIDFDAEGFSTLPDHINVFRVLIHPSEGHLSGTQGPTIDETIRGLRSLIAEYRCRY